MSSPATSISHGGSSGIKPDEIYTFSLTGFIESPPSWAFLEHLKMEVNHLNYLFFLVPLVVQEPHSISKAEPSTLHSKLNSAACDCDLTLLSIKHIS